MTTTLAPSAREELLTTTQAATFLNVRPQTLRIWRSTKRYDLPAVRVGGAVRYKLSDLQRFIDAGATPTAAAPRTPPK